MNQRIKNIFEEAQKLPVADREELAELLLATIDTDPEIDAAWGEEAHRRWDEHVRSGAETLDALAAVEDVRKSRKRRGGG